jgi:NADPH-dependent 7-cyano-7-deazaguanine reductase QueF
MLNEKQKKYKKYQQEHPEIYRNATQKCRKKLKLKVFEKLGNKCVRCGITDIRVLQIDHVNGHGNKEHKELKDYGFMLKVLADTEGNYQLLCANCNWIKRYENKE